jgi:hypothetical protein
VWQSFAELHALTVRQVASSHLVDDPFAGMHGAIRDCGAPTAAQKKLAQFAW